MINNRSILVVTALAIFLAAWSSSPTLSVMSSTFAMAAAGAACWLAERQHEENARLVAQVQMHERRTKAEEAVVVGIYGQGQLATWNYDQLIRQMKIDGHLAADQDA